MDKSAGLKEQQYESPTATIIDIEIQHCLASSDNRFNEKGGTW